MFPCDAANGSPLIDGDLLYVPTSNGVDRNTFRDPARERNRKIPAPACAEPDRAGQADRPAGGHRRHAHRRPSLHGQWSSPSLGTVRRPRRWSSSAAATAAATPSRRLASVPDRSRAAEDRLVVRLHPAGVPSRHGRHGPCALLPGRQAAARHAQQARRDVRRHERDHRHAGVHQQPRLCGHRPRPRARPRPRRPALHRRHRAGRHHRSGKIWTYQGLDRTLSTVSVADGLVYLADVGGRLHCLDAETGKCYWVHDTQCETWGSTLVADGKVYMPTSKGLWVLAAGKELQGPGPDQPRRGSWPRRWRPTARSMSLPPAAGSGPSAGNRRKGLYDHRRMGVAACYDTIKWSST